MEVTSGRMDGLTGAMVVAGDRGQEETWPGQKVGCRGVAVRKGAEAPPECLHCLHAWLVGKAEQGPGRRDGATPRGPVCPAAGTGGRPRPGGSEREVPAPGSVTPEECPAPGWCRRRVRGRLCRELRGSEDQGLRAPGEAGGAGRADWQGGGQLGSGGCRRLVGGPEGS